MKRNEPIIDDSDDESDDEVDAVSIVAKKSIRSIERQINETTRVCWVFL